MTTFVAIFRGENISEARVIAASADPGVVADVSSILLQKRACAEKDPVIASIENGKSEALRLIKQETTDESK